VIAFGLLGVFLGPTLLALGHALLREWNVAETETGERPVGTAPQSEMGLR
jgi:predicted PurR-regulated permease PerM